MKRTKFRINAIIEGECEGTDHPTIDDIQQAVEETLVIYFPEDESISKELSDSIIGITEVNSISIHREEAK